MTREVHILTCMIQIINRCTVCRTANVPKKLVDQSWRQSMNPGISLGLELDRINGENDLRHTY